MIPGSVKISYVVDYGMITGGTWIDGKFEYPLGWVYAREKVHPKPLTPLLLRRSGCPHGSHNFILQLTDTGWAFGLDTPQTKVCKESTSREVGEHHRSLGLNSKVRRVVPDIHLLVLLTAIASCS